jgi:tRNA dimethylallyltransferase
VIETTGRTISTHHRSHGFRKKRYRTLCIGLALPRNELYARIDRRVDEMMEAGLLAETQSLLDSGYNPALKSMQALGYRHMVAHIEGRMGTKEAVETLKRDHRRYAKRQMTWFRADPSLQWLAPDQADKAAELIGRFIEG